MSEVSEVSEVTERWERASEFVNELSERVSE